MLFPRKLWRISKSLKKMSKQTAQSTGPKCNAEGGIFFFLTFRRVELEKSKNDRQIQGSYLATHFGMLIANLASFFKCGLAKIAKSCLSFFFGCFRSTSLASSWKVRFAISFAMFRPITPRQGCTSQTTPRRPMLGLV